MSIPDAFEDVTVRCKANIYFDGKVASHTLRFADGSEKTLGIIHPGEYHFNTGAPETMEVVAGSCRVKLEGENKWTPYHEGESFDISGQSGFDIAVDSGLMEYICSFR